VDVSQNQTKAFRPIIRQASAIGVLGQYWYPADDEGILGK